MDKKLSLPLCSFCVVLETYRVILLNILKSFLLVGGYCLNALDLSMSAYWAEIIGLSDKMLATRAWEPAFGSPELMVKPGRCSGNLQEAGSQD